MTIIATGIDLAKHVFAVHSVRDGGVAQLRQQKVARGKLNALISGLPPGIIGMEACSGAHHWARQFRAHGHTVRLMAPKLDALPHERQARQERRRRCSRRSARPCSARTCASCRSRPRTSRRS